MKKNHLILLTGKKLTGKDTVANYLKEKYNFVPLAFADQLKIQTLDFTNIILKGKLRLEHFYNQKLKEKEIELPIIGKITPRKLLQDYGTNLIRNCFCDTYWIDFVLQKIITHYCKDNICITDCRFLNEIEIIKKRMKYRFKVVVIKISRYLPDQKDDHISENALEEYKKYDYNISNSGSLSQLNEKIENICDLIKVKK